MELGFPGHSMTYYNIMFASLSVGGAIVVMSPQSCVLLVPLLQAIETGLWKVRVIALQMIQVRWCHQLSLPNLIPYSLFPFPNLTPKSHSLFPFPNLTPNSHSQISFLISFPKLIPKSQIFCTVILQVYWNT